MVSLGQNLTSTQGDFMRLQISCTLLSNKPLKSRLSPEPALLIPLSSVLQRRRSAFTCSPFILQPHLPPWSLTSLRLQARLLKILLDLLVFIFCVWLLCLHHVCAPSASGSQTGRGTTWSWGDRQLCERPEELWSSAEGASSLSH